MTLSDTQSLVLSQASRHPERLAAAPLGLPAAARDAVFRAMLKRGLLAECAPPGGHAGLAWPQDADGACVALRITEAGLRAIGADPGEDGAPARGALEAASHTARDAPPSRRAGPRRDGIRTVAQAVLDTWDGDGDRAALADQLERLRAVLSDAGTHTPARPTAGEARAGTKAAAVLALLRRPEGASGPQLIEATGWAPHTVRGFLAGLGRKGVAVTVLERVRQAGKDGAKGSYSVYRAENRA